MSDLRPLALLAIASIVFVLPGCGARTDTAWDGGYVGSLQGPYALTFRVDAFDVSCSGPVHDVTFRAVVWSGTNPDGGTVDVRPASMEILTRPGASLGSFAIRGPTLGRLAEVNSVPASATVDPCIFCTAHTRGRPLDLQMAFDTPMGTMHASGAAAPSCR